MKRFDTEAEAVAHAKTLRGLAYVIESASREDPAAGRFIVDEDGGLIRNWERLIAIYHCGLRQSED
ncbi:MAG: hypothetical protein GY906_23460 [bacterium]|nr:hypothetical protein [bacterium]